MFVSFAKEFKKHHLKTPQKIREAFQTRLQLFKSDPFHPLLNNHKLTGKFKGLRSINITGDWRAFYIEGITSDGITTIVFHKLGTHSQLYK